VVRRKSVATRRKSIVAKRKSAVVRAAINISIADPAVTNTLTTKTRAVAVVVTDMEEVSTESIIRKSPP